MPGCIDLLREKLPSNDFLWDENEALRYKVKQLTSELKETKQSLEHYIRSYNALSLKSREAASMYHEIK